MLILTICQRLGDDCITQPSDCSTALVGGVLGHIDGDAFGSRYDLGERKWRGAEGIEGPDDALATDIDLDGLQARYVQILAAAGQGDFAVGIFRGGVAKRSLLICRRRALAF
jgi:hypothetical protein